MKQKKNGFTLIELLAVIVILAIIALIAVPVIMNIINKANKSAFKDTAYGVISAGELYFAEQQLEPNGMLEDVTFNLPDERLQLKGEVPEGKVQITKDGDVAIAVQNGRYCVIKGIEDKDVTVTEDIANCNLPSGDSIDQEIGGNGEKTLTQLAVDNFSVSNVDGSEPAVVVKPACLIDETQCSVGTPVAIRVNDTDIYRFYVINDLNNQVTLIMDRNIYASENTTEPDIAWGKKDEGPVTAITALKERTSNWTNISEKIYTYTDDGANRYQSFTETMRVRMLTLTEATSETIGCTTKAWSCPDWMYINLKNTGDDNTTGYWLSATSSTGTAYAHNVYTTGNVFDSGLGNGQGLGVRPVITLTK